MENLFSLKFTGILLMGTTLLFTSCKNGGIFKKAPEKSSNTGWTYYDPSGSGFRVSKEKEQKSGPGLVFVQGGTFTMGATEEDVMRDWNNIPRRVTVASFYMDETEITNNEYRQFVFTTVNISSGSTGYSMTPQSQTGRSLTHWFGVVNLLTMNHMWNTISVILLTISIQLWV